MGWVLVAVIANAAFPVSQTAESFGCPAGEIATGSITVNVAGLDVAGGGQVPLTTALYLYPLIVDVVELTV